MSKISEKLIKEFNKAALSKMIDLDAFAAAKEKITELEAGIKRITKLEDIDPSHVVYMAIQNQLSVFAEEFSVHDLCKQYYRAVNPAIDEYMPGYPPVSPVTGSYFGFYFLCDFRFGKDNETMCTIFRDFAVAFKFDVRIIEAIKHLSASHMRFYKHLGFDNELIELQDILTGETELVVCTSGYKGEVGEIWYVRLAPNLDTQFEYQIVLTTPYIIKQQTEKDWLDYFERKGIKHNTLGFEYRLLQHMKYNLKRMYWLNYVVDAYSTHQNDCIFLTGIPDIEGSKPHER